MTEVLERMDLVRAEFDRVSSTLPGDRGARKAALDHFVGAGFPTPRQERWRFTDLHEVEARFFAIPDSNADLSTVRGMSDGTLRNCQIAFVDGRYVPELSHGAVPAGLTIAPFSHAYEMHRDEIEQELGKIVSWTENSLVAWNSAFWR